MLLLASHSRRSHRRRRRLLPTLWSAICWPFQTIDRLEKSFVRLVRRRRERIRHKYRHSRVLAPLIAGVVRFVIAPLQLAWFLVKSPFLFIGGIATTLGAVRTKRELSHLLQGLPAALGALGLVATVMMLSSQSSDLPQVYRDQARRAFEDGHYERAQLYLQRVLQLDAETKETTYLLARTFERNGQPDRAMAIMDSLAPEDEAGHPAAHLWKAQRMGEDESTFESKEAFEAYERHLMLAAATLQGDPDLEYLLCRAKLANQDFDGALLHLRRASAQRTELAYELAMLHQEFGQPGFARDAFERALPVYESRVEQHPQDSAARLRLAEICLQFGQYDRVGKLLTEGIRRNPDGPFKEAYAKSLMREYDALPADADPGIRLALLQRALKVDPKSQDAFHRLMNFGDGGDPDQAAMAAARDLLESMIAVGESAPLAHFALGIKAWQGQNARDAVWHLERAYKLDASLADLANNLAWVLAHDEHHADPERALTLINSVLETKPDHAAYIETRGQILVKLKRWDEALDDLERALPEYQQNIQLHESLATVYENIGQTSLASKHANVAANLRKTQESAAR